MNNRNYIFDRNEIDKKKVKINDINTILGLSNYMTDYEIQYLLDREYKLDQQLTDNEIEVFDLTNRVNSKLKEFEEAYYDIGFCNCVKLENGKLASIQDKEIIAGEEVAFMGDIDYYIEIIKGDKDIGVNIKGKDELPKEIYAFAEKGKKMVTIPEQILIEKEKNSIEIPTDIGFCQGYKTDISSQILKDKLVQILGTPEKVKEYKENKDEDEIVR